MISKKLQTIFTELSETLAPPQVHTVDCRPSTTSSSTAFFTAGGLSSLEFHRDFVSTSTPVLFKGGARHLPAFRKWNKKYLIEKTKGKDLKVALTPQGRADALIDIKIEADDESTGNNMEQEKKKLRVFLAPAETTMSSEAFFSLLSESKKKYKERFVKALMKVKAKNQAQQNGEDGNNHQQEKTEQQVTKEEQEEEEDLVIPYQQAQNNCLLSDDTYRALVPDLFDRPYDLQAQQAKDRKERLSKLKSEEVKQKEKEEDELLKDYDGPQGIISEILKKNSNNNKNDNDKSDALFTQQCLVDQCSIAGFASEIFGALPDASNIWIGSELSVTSLHQDWYENFYVVIRGSKLFTLVPPTDCFAVPKIRVPEGKYEFDEVTKKFHVVLVGGEDADDDDADKKKLKKEKATDDDDNNNNEEEAEEDTDGFFWVDFDEAKTEENGGHVFRVEVEEGDVLYLPSQWYHQVAQKETHPSRRKAAATAAGATEEEAAALAAAIDENDFICAVNFWFDMKFGHGFFVQRMMKQLLGHPDAY